MFLSRQERTGFILLILVTASCAAGSYLLDGIGKDPFAAGYAPDLPEGTLVRLDGQVDEVTRTSQGGHYILKVRGIQVFIPEGSIPDPVPGQGDQIRILGTIQHWQGAPEIVVESRSDITVYR